MPGKRTAVAAPRLIMMSSVRVADRLWNGINVTGLHNGGMGLAEGDELTWVLGALSANSTRLAILRELAERGEVTVSDLAAKLGVAKTAIRSHLKQLSKAELVREVPIPPHAVGRLLAYRVQGDQLERLQRLAGRLL